MKSVSNILLTPNQTHALEEIKQRLLSQINIESLILFGSVTRGEIDDESDIDLLVLTAKSFTRYERHKITDIVFEINLHYDTNFSTLVVDRDSWETGAISVLPIHDFILNEGIQL